jgi:hypothetical protein
VPEGKDKIKIIHARDLKTWTRFLEYRDHDGLTLGEYRLRRQAAEAVLWELRHLVRAQDRLSELDVNTPVEYARHDISLPPSVRPGLCEITLPKPDHPASTITCDAGEVSGQVLRIPRSWRKRTLTARYVCPSRVLKADEIAKLKDTLSGADEEAQARLAEAQASRYLQPVLFISHRWDGTDHPDPEGQQLAKLQALKDCFLIYDYASFPQDTAAPEDEAALREILSGMNALISNVLVLAAPDFLERGWCIYEYTVASMRASIVCDELNDPNFVMLRNLAATQPPVSPQMLGHSIESGIQNAKNQRTLETVNTILPLFNRSKFTVERDREIVRDLLVSELARALPGKMEYIQYVGEWKTISWTEEELRDAFTSELKWESLQYTDSFRPFEPKVPSTVAEAVINGYRLDRMPTQNEWTWSTLLDWKPLGDIGKGLLTGILIAAGGVVLILVFLFLLVWWIFF